MSRCFPFPPPGYEKKARLDDADLLTKEKFKEKKHKKDKKDKDKRENKEKNKNRNKEKHSEKKERKEKHRDKDKSKDEGGNWAQSEKRVEGHKECHSGEEKLVPNGQQSCEVNGSKYVHDLDHRIKAEDRASGSQELHNVTASDKKSAELPKKIEEKPEEDDRKVNKHRNHVKEKHGTNSVCPNFSNMRQRRIEEITMPFDKHVEKHNEGKNDNKEKDTTQDNGREKKRKSNTKAGAREKEKKEKVEKEKEEKVEKDKVGKMNKSYIEQPKQIVNGKESINAWNAKMSQLPQMDNNSASGGIQKRKNFEMNGHSHGNGFLPHKVPMLASSHLSTENGKWEPLQVAITHTSNKRPGTTNNGEVDVKKINGFKGHERPIVTPTKPSSSAAVFRKNGEPFAKQSDSKSDNGNGQLFVKLSDPESNNGNGQLFVKLSDPESNIGNGEPLTNTPHPDSKYLSQILSVLEMGELSDYDQEWLSNGNNLQSKRPKMSPPRTEGSPQVWEQTLQINNADVFALPYVIPY